MTKQQERLRNESAYITFQDYELLLDYCDNYDNNIKIKEVNYGLYEDLELLGE